MNKLSFLFTQLLNAASMESNECLQFSGNTNTKPQSNPSVVNNIDRPSELFNSDYIDIANPNNHLSNDQINSEDDNVAETRTLNYLNLIESFEGKKLISYYEEQYRWASNTFDIIAANPDNKFDNGLEEYINTKNHNVVYDFINIHKKVTNMDEHTSDLLALLLLKFHEYRKSRYLRYMNLIKNDKWFFISEDEHAKCKSEFDNIWESTLSVNHEYYTDKMLLFWLVELQNFMLDINDDVMTHHTIKKFRNHNKDLFFPKKYMYEPEWLTFMNNYDNDSRVYMSKDVENNMLLYISHIICSRNNKYKDKLSIFNCLRDKYSKYLLEEFYLEMHLTYYFMHGLQLKYFESNKDILYDFFKRSVICSYKKICRKLLLELNDNSLAWFIDIFPNKNINVRRLYFYLKKYLLHTHLEFSGLRDTVKEKLE